MAPMAKCQTRSSPCSFFSLSLEFPKVRGGGESVYPTQTSGCSLCLCVSRLQVLFLPAPSPPSLDPFLADDTRNTPLGICSPSWALSSITTCIYCHLQCPPPWLGSPTGWGWPVTDLKRFLLSLYMISKKLPLLKSLSVERAGESHNRVAWSQLWHS